MFDDNCLPNVKDTRDIEVLFCRIGAAWKTNKDTKALAEEFDVPITTVDDAIKHHKWLYS